MLLLEILFIVVLLMFSDKIYLQWNDNLDFNIAHAKMFRDNALWRDRQMPIPFLGGIDRSIFASDYNLTSLLYYVFDPQFAYWACHGIALIYFLLIYNISTPLIGIFLIFYTVIFYVGVMLKEKKLDKALAVTLGIIAVSVCVLDRKLVGFVMKGSEGLVKGQAQTNGYVYTDSIEQCIIKLKDALLLNGSFYHAGLCVLRYVAQSVYHDDVYCYDFTLFG